MPDLILAIDQGTTSSRALVIDKALRITGVGQEEFTQHFPASGLVEHDPEDIWRTTLSTARTAIANAPVQASDIAALRHLLLQANGFPELPRLLIRDAFGDRPHDKRFQCHTDLKLIGNFVNRQFSDDNSLLRRDRNEAFHFQSFKCRLDRRLAHAQLFGQLTL